ncbi:Sarcosine oxidase subunit beta [Geodia barretti]|uniref:FAD-dependent oxidoreductase domain-containing protein 1 n=1 Tax=Geodia barretti TaxID=519541 RepID=A0AA35TFG5_GEOBA|nr:Sarcosine oxidase subunit beta [Geodia barretti]
MKKFSIFSLARNALSHHEHWPEQWRSPAPKPAYDVVIIGAGGHGLATAYYLASLHGITDVAVLEKGWLGGGNTGRNTTVIRSNYLWDESAALYEHSLKLWEGLAQELNYNLMFSQRGVLNLIHNVHDLQEATRRVNANRLNAVDGELLSMEEVKAFCPILNTSTNTRYPIMGGTCSGGAATRAMTPSPGALRGRRTRAAWTSSRIASRVRMMRSWAGIVDVCPDASPVIGKTPVDGLFINGGWGTGGFKATPGSGWVLAHTIATGEPHPLNAPFALDRFTSGALIDEHAAAAVAH